MYYIATFYSHFGAVRFKKESKGIIQKARMMPVPRTLSSSCGTCVRFEAGDDYVPEPDDRGEIEQIVREENGAYIQIYRAENS